MCVSLCVCNAENKCVREEEECSTARPLRVCPCADNTVFVCVLFQDVQTVMYVCSTECLCGSVCASVCKQ